MELHLSCVCFLVLASNRLWRAKRTWSPQDSRVRMHPCHLPAKTLVIHSVFFYVSRTAVNKVTWLCSFNILTRVQPVTELQLNSNISLNILPLRPHFTTFFTRVVKKNVFWFKDWRHQRSDSLWAVTSGVSGQCNPDCRLSTMEREILMLSPDHLD